MFIFPKIAKDILTELIQAEEAGKPLTLEEAFGKWGKSSTWEDLVDNRFIFRYPEAVTVSASGREWLKEH